MKMSVNKNSNNLLKFIISGIVLALCACQTMKPQPRTERIQNPQILTQENPQISTQEDSQVPDRDNPRNSGQSPLVGNWQGVGSNKDANYVSKYNFQPDGTFQLELTIASKNPQLASGVTVEYGIYKHIQGNSYVASSQKLCTLGQCLEYNKSYEFMLNSSTQLSSDGIIFRRMN